LPGQEVNCFRECKMDRVQNNIGLKKVAKETNKHPENSPKGKSVTPISERIIKETVKMHQSLMLSLSDK